MQHTVASSRYLSLSLFLDNIMMSPIPSFLMLHTVKLGKTTVQGHQYHWEICAAQLPYQYLQICVLIGSHQSSHILQITAFIAKLNVFGEGPTSNAEITELVVKMCSFSL